MAAQSHVAWLFDREVGRRDLCGRNQGIQWEGLAGSVREPTTDALRVIERFRRKDFGHMEVQITIDDSKAFTRPQLYLLPDTEPIEFICNENNRDLERLPGKPGR
jgi:hypothetical protein